MRRDEHVMLRPAPDQVRGHHTASSIQTPRVERPRERLCREFSLFLSRRSAGEPHQ